MRKFLTGAFVGALLLTVPTTAAFAQGRHGIASAGGCSLSGSSVGAPLTLSGTGYAPGGNYGVNFFWPNGAEGGTATTADNSGGIQVITYAYWSGSYTAQVTSGGRVVASCSVTIS